MPFDFGRPLGAPGDPGLQRRVLLAALELLDRQAGPVLEDFPGDIPLEMDSSGAPPALFACPVSFKVSLEGETGIEKLLSAFRREISELRSWYELGLEKRGHTAVAYFPPGSALKLLGDFLRGAEPGLPDNVHSLALALRLASQDLRTFYFEAALAQLGASPPGGPGFDRWFWHEAAAGRILRRVREACLASNNDEIRITGWGELVPLDQL